MRASLVLAVSVLLMGCNQGGVAQHASRSPSATDVPTQTVATPGPAQVSDLCGFNAPEPSPPTLALPAEAICASSTSGNFDGFSKNERLTTYTIRGSTWATQPWYMRVELGSGRVITADLSTYYPEPRQVSVVGAADARGDGRDEVFVVLTRGASTDFIGIFGMSGSDLVLAATSLSQRAFPIGGSVMHQGMLQCTGTGAAARLIVSGWGSSDTGKTFDWQSTTYRWSGMHLFTVSSRSGTVTSWDDPQLIALDQGLRCRGLHAPNS